VKDILEAAEEAGRQLVKDGKISEKTWASSAVNLYHLRFS
jgi:hypothetical protein